MALFYGRGVFGVIALAIAGSIFCLFVYMHVAYDFSETELFQSRLMWEIIFNLQILCLGLIWFFFAEYESFVSEHMKKVMRFRKAMSYLLVLMPMVFLMSSAYLGWYNRINSNKDLALFMVIFVGGWSAIKFIVQLIIGKSPDIELSENKEFLINKKVWDYIIFLLIGFAFLVEYIWGSIFFYVALIALLYIRGIIIFLRVSTEYMTKARL